MWPDKFDFLRKKSKLKVVEGDKVVQGVSDKFENLLLSSL